MRVKKGENVMRILITLVLAAICAFVLVVGLAGSFGRHNRQEQTIPLSSPAGEPASQRPNRAPMQPLRAETTPLPLNQAIRIVLERSQG
jgi:hypothetical protein